MRKLVLFLILSFLSTQLIASEETEEIKNLILTQSKPSLQIVLPNIILSMELVKDNKQFMIKIENKIDKDVYCSIGAEVTSVTGKKYVMERFPRYQSLIPGNNESSSWHEEYRFKEAFAKIDAILYGCTTKKPTPEKRSPEREYDYSKHWSWNNRSTAGVD